MNENKETEDYIIFLLSNIRDVMGKNNKSMIVSMKPQDIHNKIIEYLPVSEEEKQAYGEVFTPIELIEEMLNTLPKSVWKNPNLKWLDPANGVGNFPMIIFNRLDSSLKELDEFKNERKRKHHIIKNMLYMVELNEKNVGISKKIFGHDSNIFCGSFLSDDYESVNQKVFDEFGIKEFDIIVGNPPYNEGGTKQFGEKNLYVRFAKIALNDVLKKDGYLCFLHPPVYRIPNMKIQHTQINLNRLYTEKQIICIKMYSIQQTNSLMNVNINVDFITLRNTANDEKQKSTIIDTEGIIYSEIIHPNDFIPNFGINTLDKITKKNASEYLDIHLNSEMHTQHIHGTKYKNIHGITTKGIKICKSHKKHTHFHTPKLIINGIGSHNYVFHDKKGEYGITQSPVYILNPSKNTIRFVNSPLFHYIANAMKIIGNNFNKKINVYYPVIPEDNIIKNNDDIYKYFQFTKDEINQVEKYSVPTYVHQELSCKGKVSKIKTRGRKLNHHRNNKTRKFRKNKN